MCRWDRRTELFGVRSLPHPPPGHFTLSQHSFPALFTTLPAEIYYYQTLFQPLSFQHSSRLFSPRFILVNSFFIDNRSFNHTHFSTLHDSLYRALSLSLYFLGYPLLQIHSFSTLIMTLFIETYLIKSFFLGSLGPRPSLASANLHSFDTKSLSFEGTAWETVLLICVSSYGLR